MSIAISDALQQAQQAIEGGDYRSAIQTCNELVNQFPDYAAAYRVLGEAYLEQGQTADAEQAFAQALLRDPRQPWAYHGLGLIAEEQNILENALAFCQVAWELAPNYAQLRDPVIRIATRRFGADGQAQLTSAALAQIYANTARLQRAATEYRGALNDLPDRVDLKLGLAETLWQLGKNDEAADLCRQVLEENPVAIQALIILSDIDGRGGNAAEAADLRARIRAIDPDGAITATMLSRNEHADHESLLLAADAVPVLDDKAEAVVAERPHIAPAPDFSYQPARAEQPVQDIEDLEPISAEEFGDLEAELEPDTEVTAEFDTIGASETFQDDAPSIYRDESDDALLDLEQELSASEPEVADAGTVEAPADEDLDAFMAEFGDVEPMGIEEFGAEPEDLERLAATESDLLAGDDDSMFGELSSPFPSEGGADEHVRNLASALEDDVAGALDRTGEFETVEAEPKTETDTEVLPETAHDPASGTGYTTVLRELGDEGLTPFDPMGRAEMQDSPAQARYAEGDVTGQDTERTSDDDLIKLTEDWDSIDDEIARAVPITTGQTDQLRAADDLGIAPFDFETEDDTSRLPTYRPFGEEDDELPEIHAEAAEAEPDLTDTGMVAGDVETGHEETFVADAPEVVAEPEQEVTPVAAADEDLLDNLEPFSLEEFDEDEEGDKPFSFGSLPWETGSTGSAVPSDEDLDLLLSPDGEALQPAEEANAPAVAPDWPARVLDTSETEPEEPVDWTTAVQDQEDVVVEDVAEAAAEDEPLVEDVPSTWDVPSDWDSSLAVTRQIRGEPDDLAEGLAAAEAAAQAGGDELVGEPVAQETPQTSGLSGVDAEKLVTDEDIFERSRSAKTDLIAQGAISGDLAFEAEDTAPTDEVESETEPEWAAEAPVEDAPAEEDFVVATGATRDVNTLRASLEVAPDDDELHWWLAEALRERGDAEEAFGQYRWLIRNAPHRSDNVVAALNASIENEQHAEMGHRLLADIYRRRGAVSLASSHAAAAMAARRRLRG